MAECGLDSSSRSPLSHTPSGRRGPAPLDTAALGQRVASAHDWEHIISAARASITGLEHLLNSQQSSGRVAAGWAADNGHPPVILS